MEESQDEFKKFAFKVRAWKIEHSAVMPTCRLPRRWFLLELYLWKAHSKTDAKNNMINFSYLFHHLPTKIWVYRLFVNNTFFIYIYVMFMMPKVDALIWEINVEIMKGTSNLLPHPLPYLILTIHFTVHCILLIYNSLSACLILKVGVNSTLLYPFAFKLHFILRSLYILEFIFHIMLWSTLVYSMLLHSPCI